MKMAAVVSIAGFLLLASSAASQTPDDNLIVPGQRIGKWTLAMSVEAIVKVLGEPPFLMEGLSERASSFNGQDEIRLLHKPADTAK